jgi:cell division protein FtsB
MMNKFMIAATEERWRQEAEAVRQEAENEPLGRRREALVREARRLRTASQIDQWLSSPELQPPN